MSKPQPEGATTGPDTIILHVGLHKTGSTSIQNCAEFRHRELLLAHGIRYGEFRLEGKSRPNHGGPVAAAVFDDPDKYGEEWRQKLFCTPAQAQQACRDQLARMLHKPDVPTLVLSGELFSVLERPDMETLRDRLGEHCSRLRVLALIRNPLSFMESTLQQRVRGGKLPDPGDLAALERRRYLRLHRVFGDCLEVLNFDECAGSDLGLVGSFYRACGVAENALTDLDVGTANPRTSLEAFRLMRAINERYPNLDHHPASALRRPRDMQSLHALPGARFSWRECNDPAVAETARRESEWFAENTGLVFPEPAEPPAEEPWSFATLACLEDSIRDIEHPLLREVAIEYLQAESERLPPSRADTRTVMQFIIRQLREARRQPPKKLRDLGAEYFINAAQQARSHSPELAVRLLAIALEINPDSDSLAQRLRQWRAEHFMEPGFDQDGAGDEPAG